MPCKSLSGLTLDMNIDENSDIWTLAKTNGEKVCTWPKANIVK